MRSEKVKNCGVLNFLLSMVILNQFTADCNLSVLDSSAGPSIVMNSKRKLDEVTLLYFKATHYHQT